MYTIWVPFARVCIQQGSQENYLHIYALPVLSKFFYSPHFFSCRNHVHNLSPFCASLHSARKSGELPPYICTPGRGWASMWHTCLAIFSSLSFFSFRNHVHKFKSLLHEFARQVVRPKLLFFVFSICIFLIHPFVWNNRLIRRWNHPKTVHGLRIVTLAPTRSRLQWCWRPASARARNNASFAPRPTPHLCIAVVEEESVVGGRIVWSCTSIRPCYHDSKALFSSQV
jgi:hypothetical protein